MNEIVKKVLDAAISHLSLSGVMADVSFASNEEIKELNKKHMGKDDITDVLSFPLIEWRDATEFEIKSITDPETGLANLGDIVICMARAEEQAEELGHSIEREIAFLSLHGFLHLLGYNHQEMEVFYNAILEKAGYPR